MTKPATSIEYVTIPVATVVGATLKLSTIPPRATGREATLKDMIAWPSAMAIIGTQDSCARASVPVLEMAWTDMTSLPVRICGAERRMNAGPSGFGLRHEQIHTQPLRQELGDE